jgi:hypothetical protein
VPAATVMSGPPLRSAGHQPVPTLPCLHPSRTVNLDLNLGFLGIWLMSLLAELSLMYTHTLARAHISLDITHII